MAKDIDKGVKKRLNRGEQATAELDPANEATAEKIAELFQKIEPLMDQVNMLYNHYIRGIEDRPPAQHRKRLEQLIANIHRLNKGPIAQQFRVSNLNYTYLTYQNRWDKLMKDVETGRILRVKKGSK